MSAGATRRRLGARERAWALTFGVVLADSSIVTLALPEILVEYDASVFGVSWVLTSFNLVLAAAVIPAARLARRRMQTSWIAGMAIFSAASLACALAPSVGALIAARCAQALGGAAIVASAIELLAGARGSHRAAAGIWGAAGLAGLAVGPGLGGLLTELLSWESIFLLQVPIPLATLAATSPPTRATEPGPAGAVDAKPEIALGLISAGLTGALFLLVVMLTEGWRLTPLEAALVVSVMPAATLGAGVFAERAGRGAAVMIAGAVAIAGGLVALGLVPGARWGWTLAPQALVGIGIALAIPGLTQWALAVRDPAGHRAAATIAARHAGVVIGLVALTPLFSAELDGANEAAQRSGTALLLDAPLGPETKIALAEEIGARIEAAGGRLPELGPAFDGVEVEEGSEADLSALRASIVAEVEKAATSAFSLAFLAAGVLALCAAVPIAIGRRRQG